MPGIDHRHGNLKIAIERSQLGKVCNFSRTGDISGGGEQAVLHQRAHRHVGEQAGGGGVQALAQFRRSDILYCIRIIERQPSVIAIIDAHPLPAFILKEQEGLLRHRLDLGRITGRGHRFALVAEAGIQCRRLIQRLLKARYAQLQQGVVGRINQHQAVCTEEVVQQPGKSLGIGMGGLIAAQEAVERRRLEFGIKKILLQLLPPLPDFPGNPAGGDRL